MDAIIAPRQPEMGEGGEVAPARVIEPPCILPQNAEFGVVEANAQDSRSTFRRGIKQRRADPSLLLHRAFRHAHQQAHPALVPEHPGIEQTFHDHVGPTGADLGGRQDGVLLKAMDGGGKESSRWHGERRSVRSGGQIPTKGSTPAKSNPRHNGHTDRQKKHGGGLGDRGKPDRFDG